jgi:DNA-binding NarL/FixJ family response regulator
MKMRIVIADDQMLTREGLRTILDLEEDMEVVGVAKDGLEACELAERLQPDLLLMDVQMPNMDGITAMKRIKRQQPGIAILILTTFMEEDYIVEGMAGGASGYLLKDMEGDRMITAVRDAYAGQFILPTAVAAKLANRISSLMAENEHWRTVAQSKLERVKLTDREKEIARLIIKGMNNRDIAESLQVAEGTARNYISSLYGKLEVNDRAQAIVHLQALI